jgi:hypothetical protein
MSEDWKDERAEAAMREGTDKIMKAAQEKAKKEKQIAISKEKKPSQKKPKKEKVPSPELAEETNKTLSEAGGLEEYVKVKSEKFEVCLGVGLNQFFPEYISIDLSEEN